MDFGHADGGHRLRPGRSRRISVIRSITFPKAPGSRWSSRPIFARRGVITSIAWKTGAGIYSVEASFERLIRFPSIAISTLAADSLETTCHMRIESIERFSGELTKVKAELESAAAGEHVLIACHNAAEVERLGEVFSDTELAGTGRLHLTEGRIRAGFHLIDARTLVIGDHELFARAEVRRPVTRRRYESRAIDSFLDLNEGDLVVHVNHGIARYRGLHFVDQSAEHAEETLLLEFAEGTKLYVPIAKIDLVQKYVGGGKAEPALSKMGSSTWEKRKKRVADGRRRPGPGADRHPGPARAREGFAFPAQNSHWVAEFEAAFPYEETPDQLSAIEAVKRDMSQGKPMDRLICGDVGYGKTEVAIRGAFRAVDSGKQVAVLVPTTILAEQHHRSFGARMAEFPFVIEVVNRFRPKAEIREVLKRAGEGKVDILIGTHRILQKDVAFKDLGLVIIDEEQRFGVEDKEWLKTLRTTVDVLTLSATPIPRTLHMSLLGIRDISNLETPPPDRKAIETRVCRFDREIVKRAIHRELNRDGQIYFVHNRVYDITTIADTRSIDRARGQDRNRPRPDVRRRARAHDDELHPPAVRHPGRHDDHRERPGYPQRQHHLHQRGRQVRSGRPPSAPRPGRPVQASCLCVPACSSRIGR